MSIRFGHKLERALTFTENAIAFIALTLMTVLVCCEVLIRGFTRPESKTKALLVWLWSRVSGEGGLSSSGLERIDVAATGVVAFSIFILLFAALKSASRSTKLSRDPRGGMRVLGATCLIFFGLWLSLQTLLYLFPQGIPDARAIALGLMVWAALMGASIAIREDAHIRFGISESMESFISPLLQKAAPLVSAFFCAGFVFLSGLKLLSALETWWAIPGAERFPSLPIPTWIVTLALPVGFSLMTLRFLLRWRK